jgi:hypothetical protein
MFSCCQKQSVLSHLDDSVKVMVRHDAKVLKKKGQTPSGYVPRAPHPLLHEKKKENEKKNDAPKIEATEEDDQ